MKDLPISSLGFGTVFNITSTTVLTNKLSIGAIERFALLGGLTELEFPTGIIELPTEVFGRIYIKPAYFKQIGQNDYVTYNPGPPYWYFSAKDVLLNTSANPVLGVTYPLTYVGPPEAQQDANLTITFNASLSSPNVTIFFYVEGYHILQQDMNTYPGANISNNQRLLYNSINGIGIDDNTVPSAYNENRVESFIAYYLPDEDDLGQPINPNDVGAWYLGLAEPHVTRKWYNRDNYNNPPVDITNFCLQFRRPLTTIVQDLNDSSLTRCRIRFNTTFDDIKVVCYLINTDNTLNSVPFLVNYAHALREITTVAGLGTPLPSTAAVPAWAEGIPDAFVGISSGPNELSPDLWECSFFIDGSKLVSKGNYRLITVVYYKSNPMDPDEAWDSYSFLSENLYVNNVPELCPPDVTGFLSDYRQVLSNYIIASPQERLRATTNWDGDRYNLCRITPFLSALKTITIRIYYEIPDFRHVLQVNTISKNLLNQWDVPASSPLFISEDVTNQRIQVNLDFRIRYEANASSFYTENILSGTQIFQALANQDWTNKSLIIETTLTCEQSTPALFKDILVFKQQVDVHDFDENENDCLEIDFYKVTPSGARLPLKNFCDDIEFVEAVVTDCVSTNPDSDHNGFFIAGLDRKSYSITRFKESESWDNGILPQLNEQPFIANQTTQQFNNGAGGNEALAVIDATQLNLGDVYRFTAIKKMAVSQLSICGRASAGSFGTPPPATYDIGGSGDSIIVYDMYEASDKMDVYNALTNTLIDTTGSVRGHGMIIVASNGSIKVEMPAKSNWWYKPFCVGQIDGECGSGTCVDPNELVVEMTFQNGLFYSVRQLTPSFPNGVIVDNDSNGNDTFRNRNQRRLWVGSNAYVIDTGANGGTVSIPYTYYGDGAVGYRISAFSYNAALFNGTPKKLNALIDQLNPGVATTTLSFANDGPYVPVPPNTGLASTGTVADLIPSNPTNVLNPSLDYPASSGLLSLVVTPNDKVIIVITSRPLVSYNQTAPPYTDLRFDPRATINDPVIPPFEPPIITFTVSCPV